MTLCWIKYLADPTGYISVNEAANRLKMNEHQIYRWVEFEQIELVQYQHEDYFPASALSRMEDPHQLGDPHQELWSPTITFMDDPLEDMPPCSLEHLSALISSGAIPIGMIFKHRITCKRVRCNGQGLEHLGILGER